MLVIDPATTSAAISLPAHLGWALAITLAFSLLLASIEIADKSKMPLLSCLVFQSFLYCSIRAFGNVVATLLASALVVKIDPGLAAYYFLFAAFLGIFSFETILKNMNITVSGAGFLTLQAWMDKALNVASAAAIEQDIRSTHTEIEKLANRLSKITDLELNAFIAFNLANQGTSIVQTLENAAKANNANPRLIKGYAAATGVSRNQVIAFLKGQEHR